MLKTGMVLNERYEIEKVIGEGGMAVVYKGIDHKLHRDVAIKVLRPELSADEVVISKFRKEGLNAASLSHNNIVGVYDLGRQNGSDYIVMEYIDGITLKEYIERRKKLSNDEIFKISVKIADALKAAHASNIIHRDIKPQNIMVTPKGGVKVTDFGIAKATTTSTMTAQGEAMGSVHYFSPEQARGQRVDTRSDLYSLGITMFEMATSHLPFEGDTPIATAMKQIHDPLPNIQDYNPEIWPGLVGIIQKLTNKQPEERYQNADEVLEDLKRVYQNHGYLPDNKGTAGPYVPPQQPGTGTVPPVEEEPKKKHTGLWVGLCLGLVLLLAAGGFLIKNMLSRNGGQESAVANGKIPSLIGLSEEEAVKKANDSGYYVALSAEHYNDEYDKGVVYDQEPAQGTEAELGMTINIIVSMGEYNADKVPNVEDMSYAEAVNYLIEAGIPYHVITEASEDVEMGDIISQEPAGDTEVSEDTVVTLTVSTGSENEGVEVPELTGLTREEAVTKLKDLKLNLGEVSLSYHDTVPSGQIIAQDLDPKLRIPEGTSINVTISQGVPTDEEEENSANGTIMINNPLAADQESGQLRVEAINASGNSSGLYDQLVTQETFANGGLEISYPSSTVKIRVYLDGNEVFVRDIN